MRGTQPQVSISRDLRISSLQSFAGTSSEDASQWLRIFERHASRQGWSEAETLEEAVSYLRGSAELWYTNELEKSSSGLMNSWTTWKDQFNQKYVKVETPMDQLNQLLRIKKTNSESVKDYICRVQDLARRVGHLATDETVLVAFKAGLEAHFLLELEEKEVKTLEQAIMVIEKKEKLDQLKNLVLAQDGDTEMNGEIQGNQITFGEKADLLMITENVEDDEEPRSYVEVEVEQEQLMEFLNFMSSPSPLMRKMDTAKILRRKG